ncbi:MAG: SOS response-associated peptidase [Balneolales bacterium]
MTGRYALFTSKEKTEDHFQAVSDSDVIFEPNYNIAPGHLVPAIYMEKAHEKRVGYLQWGLESPESGGKTESNVKAESLIQKNTLRKAFQRKRCIIPANGFYEWKALTAELRLPFYIRLLDEEIFGFAGIYDRWTTKDKEVFSFAIITTKANELLQPLHDRMPVILQPNDYDYWLDPINSDHENLSELLKPFPTDQMSTYRVNKEVDDLKINSPDLIKPVM